MPMRTRTSTSQGGGRRRTRSRIPLDKSAAARIKGSSSVLPCPTQEAFVSDRRPVATEPCTVSRRAFVKVAGAGLAGSSLVTLLSARQAPAQLKGTSLRVLMWSHFVPAYDAWLDDFAKQWSEKNGVKVRIDHIPHLELPARYAAEFAAGAGHDLIYFVGQILTGQYYRNLIDLGDLADGLA